MRVRYTYDKDEFRQSMENIQNPVFRAGADAVREATDIAHSRGQADIAASGLGPRWVKSFKQKFYLNHVHDAAGIVYSTINFSVVFERGAVVQGNPKLWIPLSTTPKKIGRKNLTAERVAHEIGRLIKIEIGGKEYLALRVAVSKNVASGPLPRMSAGMLRTAARKKAGKRLRYRLIPMFVGADSTTIRKRLHIGEIVERAANELPDLYDKYMTEDE